jgi:hypothetical protein
MSEISSPARSSAGLVVKPLHTLKAPAPPPALPPPPGRSGLIFTVAAVVLAVGVGAALAGQKVLDRLLDGLDDQAFERANLALGQSLAEKQERALASVKLLVDDTRVRATVITPNFDEATVADVLEDLRAASGASVVAVLNVAGTVKARTGADLLKQQDLGSVTAVKKALGGPAAAVWSLPERVLVTAVAPIRTGAEVAALLMLGYDLDAGALAAIERLSPGLAGAVVIADRVAGEPANRALFEAARAVAETGGAIAPQGQSLLVRATRTSDSAAAGRVLWILPRHHRAGALGALRVVVWAPAVLVAVMLALMALHVRRR